jgi:hypothetical protein
MEVVAAIAVIALLVSNLLWLRAYQGREETTTTERRELLTRITHPELIPVATPTLPPDSELLTADSDDDYGLVGTVEGGPQLEGDSNANGNPS